MKTLSIDIGSKSVAAVEGYIAGGNVIIQSACTGYLPDGAVFDGLIKDAGAVRRTLVELIENNNIKTRSAIVTISSGNSLTREFDLPLARKKQLTAMARNEMINVYAADSSDVIEYKTLGEVAPAEGEPPKAKKVHIKAMALKRNIVDGYYELLGSLKLRPVAMDANPNAVEKLLSRKVKLNGWDMENENYLLIDFGFSGMMVYVANGPKVYLSRYIPLGMADLASMLAGQLLISHEQQSGEFASLLDFVDADKKTTVAMMVASNFMAQCCNELQRVVMYIISRLPKTSISRIFVCGGGSEIKGVERVIGDYFDTDAQILSSVSCIQLKNLADSQFYSRYLNAAGALIRL